MCVAGGGGLDEVVFSEPCFSGRFGTDLDQIDFAQNFKGDEIDPLCLCINIAFNPGWMRAVCAPDGPVEAATTYFHLFKRTDVWIVALAADLRLVSLKRFNDTNQMFFVTRIHQRSRPWKQFGKGQAPLKRMWQVLTDVIADTPGT